MVKNHILLSALIFTILLLSFTSAASAASNRAYHLGQEWIKIWINPDGTIDLFYNISITLDSGDNISYVLVGQPTHDFTMGSAIDQYSYSLSMSDASSGSGYKVRVNLASPLTAGHTGMVHSYNQRWQHDIQRYTKRRKPWNGVHPLLVVRRKCSGSPCFDRFA